jgi:hypothetical protein
MDKNSRQHGFSLLETLLAVSTLAVGMVFVAGTFMGGIYFTSLSTERTIAAVTADEAFAKIRLYGLDPNDPNLATDTFVAYDELATVPTDEFLYPSVAEDIARQYSWMALCRRMGADSRLVQVTVFVCRHTGNDTRYWVRASDALEQGALPRPVRIPIVRETGAANDEVSIVDAVASDGIDENVFANDGAILVDDATGQIYRVLQRYREPSNRIQLDRPWSGGEIGGSAETAIWVVPPSVAGGRSPLVGVYQQVMRF